MTISTSPIKLTEKIGYGMGDAAFNFVWMTFIYFGTFFYTDVFGISPAAVGTLFLITRFWDVINDPIMGLVADRTNTRWGKFRPYLLFGSLPLGIFATLCFTTPDISAEAKVIYAFITYFLVGMVYTTVNIPYSSMLSVMTSNTIERTGFSSARLIGAFSAGLAVQFFTQDLVKLFGAGNDQVGYQYTMGLYSFVLVFLLVMSFKWTKERRAPEKPKDSNLILSIVSVLVLFGCFYALIKLYSFSMFQAKLTASNIGYWASLIFYLAAVILTVYFTFKKLEHLIPKDVRALLSNIPFWVLFFVGIFTLSWVSIRGASMMYYFKYFLGAEDLVKYYMGFFTVCNILGAFLTQSLCKYWDKRNIFIALMLFNSLTIAAVYHINPDNMFLFSILHFSNGLLAGPLTVIVFAMYADITDYTQVKTGQRIDGLVFSGASFSQKMGWTVGGAGAGFILAFFNYEANVEQTEESLHGIRLMFTYIPALLSVLAAGAMAMYRLSENKMKDIQAQLPQT